LVRILKGVKEGFTREKKIRNGLKPVWVVLPGGGLWGGTFVAKESIKETREDGRLCFNEDLFTEWGGRNLIGKGKPSKAGSLSKSISNPLPQKQVWPW